MIPKSVVGNIARKDKFFKREKDIRSLWAYLAKGSNILVSAPRRMGKTSLLFHILDNPVDGFRITYLTTESVNMQNEYFRKLYRHILDTLEGIEKYKNAAADFIKKLSSRIEKIGMDGITMGDEKIKYYEELSSLLKALKLNDDRLVIVNDEFAQTIMNIIDNEGNQSATELLEKCRELRQIPELAEKIQFVYAGSIGLENITGKLGQMKTIADINSFKLKPLSSLEGLDFLNFLLEGSDLAIDDLGKSLILNSIDWLSPFFIQILVQEIDNIYMENEAEINEITIEIALKQMLESRNYYEHWLSRLQCYLKTKEFNFAKELLNFVSDNGVITGNQIHDFAVKYKIEKSYKEVMNTLIYDGYINNDSDPVEYRFNSPILKMWWWKYVAN